jgi:glycosyltransferase involved in cell wall biosynthesis
MAFISVILPVRNGASVIATQLDALARQRTRHQFELIVADHASTDGTVEVARGFTDRFEHLVLHAANTATNGAGVRNSALTVARSNYLAFCDCDDLAHPEWLEHLVEPILSRPCQAAGRLVYNYTAPPLTPEAFAKKVVRPPEYMRHRRFADNCSMAVRRDDLISVGMYNATYDRSSDVDLSWRLQRAGIPLVDAERSIMAKLMPLRTRDQMRKFAMWAFHEPRIYRDHRADGIERRRLRDETRHLASAVIGDARAAVRRTPPSRTPLALAEAAGRLAGSYHWRVWYP